MFGPSLASPLYSSIGSGGGFYAIRPISVFYVASEMVSQLCLRILLLRFFFGLSCLITLVSIRYKIADPRASGHGLAVNQKTPT